MGVAEVEHVGTRGIEKGGGERIEALAAPYHGCMLGAGKFRERSQRGFDRGLAAADQRHGEKIDERTLGLMNDGRAERVPLRLGDELRQPCGHCQIVRHRGPREAGRASTGPGKSARMADQSLAFDPFRSSSRKRGPKQRSRKKWIPAAAGMSGAK